MTRKHEWGDGTTSIRARDGRRYAQLWVRDHTGKRIRVTRLCLADDNTVRRAEREPRDCR